jgi:hypothetical protein
MVYTLYGYRPPNRGFVPLEAVLAMPAGATPGRRQNSAASAV